MASTRRLGWLSGVWILGASFLCTETYGGVASVSTENDLMNYYKISGVDFEKIADAADKAFGDGRFVSTDEKGQAIGTIHPDLWLCVLNIGILYALRGSLHSIQFCEDGVVRYINWEDGNIFNNFLRTLWPFFCQEIFTQSSLPEIERLVNQPKFFFALALFLRDLDVLFPKAKEQFRLKAEKIQDFYDSDKYKQIVNSSREELQTMMLLEVFGEIDEDQLDSNPEQGSLPPLSTSIPFGHNGSFGAGSQQEPPRKAFNNRPAYPVPNQENKAEASPAPAQGRRRQWPSAN